MSVQSPDTWWNYQLRILAPMQLPMQQLHRKLVPQTALHIYKNTNALNSLRSTAVTEWE